MPEGPLHDPVAVAVLADPGCVRAVRTRLDILGERNPVSKRNGRRPRMTRGNEV